MLITGVAHNTIARGINKLFLNPKFFFSPLQVQKKNTFCFFPPPPPPTHTHTHTTAQTPCIDVNDDTAGILRELSDLESEYYTIAIHLHLPPGKVKTIQKDNPHSSLDALGQVITEWLKRNYEYSKFGRPSWKMLVDAVSMVDVERAKTIAINHKKPKVSFGDIIVTDFKDLQHCECTCRNHRF